MTMSMANYSKYIKFNRFSIKYSVILLVPQDLTHWPPCACAYLNCWHNGLVYLPRYFIAICTACNSICSIINTAKVT